MVGICCLSSTILMSETAIIPILKIKTRKKIKRKRKEKKTITYKIISRKKNVSIRRSPVVFVSVRTLATFHHMHFEQTEFGNISMKYRFKSHLGGIYETI